MPLWPSCRMPAMEVNELTDEQYQAFVDAVQPMYDEYKQQWGTEIFDLATSYNK